MKLIDEEGTGRERGGEKEEGCGGEETETGAEGRRREGV